MEFKVKFNLNDEQMEELVMLQKAMKKATDDNDADNYYTLEKVFNFCMELGSVHKINRAIENAAYHYDGYYEDYPYQYGIARSKEILEKEKEVGHYLSTAYPNPRIVRD